MNARVIGLIIVCVIVQKFFNWIGLHTHSSFLMFLFAAAAVVISVKVFGKKTETIPVKK